MNEIGFILSIAIVVVFAFWCRYLEKCIDDLTAKQNALAELIVALLQDEAEDGKIILEIKKEND